MQRPLPLVLVLTLGLVSTGRGEETTFQPIFDGKTLDGWNGDAKLWSVRDGAITGVTDGNIPNNSFIIWKGTVANFELKLQFKIVGGNSGIQYRSKQVGKPDEFIVAGYQADIDSAARKHQFTGILYEERGRGFLCNRGARTYVDVHGDRFEQKIADSDELAKSLKPDDWNAYHVIAKGNRLTHTINGKVFSETIDFQKDKAATEGILAFQIHRGMGQMTVQFKDIQLRKLPAGGVLTPEDTPIPADAVKLKK